LQNSISKPTYLATTEFIDTEMKIKIQEHKQNRKDDFKTIEEPLKIYDVILNTKDTVIIECVSMWINNMLYHGFGIKDMILELKKIFTLDNDIVFVLNDVGNSVVSGNKLTRKFVNINGKIAQLIASECDEVYHNIAGISVKIK
jgi:adenosylcobinamide kinase/adenosylcobinamide-phosphate guanylyltransferase